MTDRSSYGLGSSATPLTPSTGSLIVIQSVEPLTRINW